MQFRFTLTGALLLDIHKVFENLMQFKGYVPTVYIFFTIRGIIVQ